uniref:Uncharacterized protein n=1 Tax=Arundo donax TaxID=35708 RepID=A0A0A9FD63_ARUDO
MTNFLLNFEELVLSKSSTVHNYI